MGLKFLTIMSALLASQFALAATSTDHVSLAKPASLQLQDQTEVPDATLKPGAYTILISNHLADRVIVEVKSADGVDEKFLGVPSKGLGNSAAIGPVVEKGSDGKKALRGFTFSGRNEIEFVYPKNDAVALAKENNVAMLAIDPASEGIEPSPNLSAEDMKIVTMWVLTPTRVSPGIQAAKYAPPSKNERAEARPPVLSKLPKTASDLPLLLLVGMGAFGVASFLSFRRLRAGTF